MAIAGARAVWSIGHTLVCGCLVLGEKTGDHVSDDEQGCQKDEGEDNEPARTWDPPWSASGAALSGIERKLTVREDSQ